MQFLEWKKNCNNCLLTNRGGWRVKPAMTVILLMLLFLNNNMQAQDMVAPMDIPLFLSGNFGELRNNHFHSGDDFKTQGVTGIPVKSVKDGYVSRIGVSPYGYGNVLYIDHPDGTTSVYGHLDRFIPRIESVVRDSQYLKESFSVNLYFQPGQLPVKKGERIAWSGNTGGSGGPHLHFEFRETESEKAIDPLPYFKNKVKDTRPPEVRGIMLFPQPGKGIANGSTHNQPVTLLKDKAGNQSAKQPVTAWGQIGVGIKAYDRMNETTNIYGVNEIILKVDGGEVYHSVMDKFSIDDTRYLNTYIDWKEWTENNSFYMKSFTDPGNYLGVNRAKSNGIIDIDKEKVYHLEYILKDAFGNTTTFRFDITGKKASIPPIVMNGSYFPQNKDNAFYGKGIDLKIPQNNLYSDVFFKTDFVPNYTPFAPLYILGERTPLHSYCPLTLEITNDTYPDKSKYGIIQVLKNKRNWIGGEYEDGKITAKIRELGRFTIDVDTVPPAITPVNQANWEKNKRITFKITDDLSGIASYRGTINGEFILFQYDYKTNSLYHEYDSKRVKYGNGTLHLVVTDEAGNQSEWFK